MRKNRTLAVAVLLIFISLYPASASAAIAPPAGLSMEVSAAFGGYVKYGEWLPVWAQLENNGPDLEAEIRVRVTGSGVVTTFAVPVSLPTGSRKRVPVYVLPNNFSRQLEVQLVDVGRQSSNGAVLVTQKAFVKPQFNITFLVGLISPQRGALSLIANAVAPQPERSIVLVDLPLADLPERVEGLSSFDCLIINDTDTFTLTPEQKAALESWVRRGGRLVIGGGAGARQTVSGLPERLLPLIPRREIEVNMLPALTELGGEAVRVLGPFLVSTGDLSEEGRTLAVQGSELDRDGNLAIVREKIVSTGYVDWVALDLATSPFDAWAGTPKFWERLILADAAYAQNLPSDMSPRQVRSDQMIYALTNLPSLDLPSVKGLSILLGIYILLVGPLNYLVLRWRKKLHWAWGTIPAITLLFSGGAFGLGYALRGTDLIVNKIAVVAAQSDGTAQVTAYIGLFSPARQSYEITVDNSGGLLSPMNPSYDPWGQGNSAGQDLVFVQSTPGKVRGLSVNQWSMQTLMTEDVWLGLGQVTHDLRFEDGKLVGTVRNGTGLALKDAVVAIGNQFTRLGDLAPGAQADVHLGLSQEVDQLWGASIGYRLFEQEFNTPNGPSRQAQLKQQILDNVFNTDGKFAMLSSVKPMDGSTGSPQGLLLIAWLEQAPPEVQVAGREPAQQTTALFYLPLTYRLAEQGLISVPVGFIPGRIAQMPTDGGPCGPSGLPSIYIGSGAAVFEFQLPEDASSGIYRMQIERLLLSLRSDSGQAPQVSLYNWVDQDWMQLDKPIVGDNAIVATAGLISADGLVRIRIARDSNSMSAGCFYVGMGFEGKQ